jgi:hypothetical protein
LIPSSNPAGKTEELKTDATVPALFGLLELQKGIRPDKFLGIEKSPRFMPAATPVWRRHQPARHPGHFAAQPLKIHHHTQTQTEQI